MNKIRWDWTNHWPLTNHWLALMNRDAKGLSVDRNHGSMINYHQLGVLIGNMRINPEALVLGYPSLTPTETYFWRSYIMIWSSWFAHGSTMIFSDSNIILSYPINIGSTFTNFGLIDLMILMISNELFGSSWICQDFSGSIKSLSDRHGYGFIACDEVHRSCIESISWCFFPRASAKGSS